MTDLKSGGINYSYTVPVFDDFMVGKHGYLTADPACLALFFYAMQMKENLKQRDEPIKLEASGDSEINCRNVWKSAAMIYGVQPEEMVKYWPNVSMTLKLHGSADVPEFYKMRTAPEIKTTITKAN